MSGAFSDLAESIKKRMVEGGIGFGASVTSQSDSKDYLQHVSPEDLIKYGFETEFVGRLPVVAVFEHLGEEDLHAILRNPNNPVVLSKKRDFQAYDISVKFDDAALRELARLASEQQTGARGLVSAMEKVLLSFEKTLPSTVVKTLPVTEVLVKNPSVALEKIVSGPYDDKWTRSYEKLVREERTAVKKYVRENQAALIRKSKLPLTLSRINLIADLYAKEACRVGTVIAKIASYYDQVKKVEAYFQKTHDLNIELDESAIDLVMLRMVASQTALGDFYKELTTNFEYGFKLVRDRVGQNTFQITKKALENPDGFFEDLVKKAYAEDDKTSDKIRTRPLPSKKK
jgi:hypothetical protein